MKEKLICSNKILSNVYEYYLVESMCNIESLGEFLRYGVKIVKYNLNNRIVDSKCIPDILDNKNKMIKAIRILGKLQVTPITLEDIVIDNI